MIAMSEAPPWPLTSEKSKYAVSASKIPTPEIAATTTNRAKNGSLFHVQSVALAQLEASWARRHTAHTAIVRVKNGARDDLIRLGLIRLGLAETHAAGSRQ